MPFLPFDLIHWRDIAAARRLMQDSGLRDDQVTQVRGYADQKLRKPGDPLDPSNRRISVIVQYVVKDPKP